MFIELPEHVVALRAAIKDFVDRRLGLVSLAFCICLVGGFYIFKVVLH